ncbi:MAG: FlgO family outer membrane protein [Rhodothermales bacterium]
MPLVGQTIDNYKILSQLGSGGMGVVYKARDTRLDRLVALKFLPPDLSRDDEANERFMQEAKAASALHHPNICAIHDIKETDDGRLYIVMPLYEGQTLKYRLQDGPLDHDSAVDIVRHIASGLGAAHKKGIVHRDIKPANVMVTDSGRVIILDFGVAKLTGGLDLTKTGSTIGTAYYMSPEQVRGETVDARADLWALGVVFYQMLTGRRPFEGDYEQAVSYSILNSEPTVDADSVGGQGEVLRRLLAKNRDERFSSADELISELEPLKRGSEIPSQQEKEPHSTKVLYVVTAVVLVAALVVVILRPWQSNPAQTANEHVSEPTRHAIAVLPFINLRSDPETDFLGYAMADQVIASLSYVQNVNVRPASSVRVYQDKEYNARDAGRSLSVDYVVTGNYLRQAERMRLTVEMVDVDADEIIWTEPIDVESSDVFEIQDIVTQKVLEQLKVSFSDDERGRMQIDVSADPVAYEYYLRAISYPRTREGDQKALDLLDQSLALDSTFAPAWGQLGWRRHALGMFGMVGEQMSRSAEAAFKKALELNPELISALVDVSTYYTDSGRTDEAYELALRAIQINPNNALGHFARGYSLRYAGMMEESEREMRAALALDSTNTRFRSAGITLMVNGRYEDARRAFAIDAPSPYFYGFTAETYLAEGKVDEAIPLFERAELLGPGQVPGLRATAFLGYLSGDHEKGLAAARKIEAAHVVDAETDHYVATYYCINGDSDACLRNLERAVKNGYFNYEYMRDRARLDLIRGTPEFDKILEVARQKHERFKKKYFSDR